MSTLENWSTKQPYRVEYRGDTGARWAKEETATAATIPDSALIDRPEAWHLKDWLVSSVVAGSIWFVRREPDHHCGIMNEEERDYWRTKAQNRKGPTKA